MKSTTSSKLRRRPARAACQRNGGRLASESVVAFDRIGWSLWGGIRTWAQASQGAPGRQAILKALAGGPATRDELATQTGLTPAETEAAIAELENHDILTRDDSDGTRRCTVELMRRWLAQRAAGN